MLRPIAEADWKRFRQLQGLALERFCQRVLAEAAGLAAETGRSSHDRYLALYRLLQDRDKELAAAFDGPRRSTALVQLARIRAAGLLTEEEFSGFSEETRSIVEFLVEGCSPSRCRRTGCRRPIPSPPRAAAPRPAWEAVRTAACTPG